MATRCVLSWLIFILVFNCATSGLRLDSGQYNRRDKSQGSTGQRPDQEPSWAAFDDQDEQQQQLGRSAGGKDIPNDLLQYLFERTAAEAEARLGRQRLEPEQLVNYLAERPELETGQPALSQPDGSERKELEGLLMDYFQTPEQEEVQSSFRQRQRPGPVFTSEVPEGLFDYLVEQDESLDQNQQQVEADLAQQELADATEQLNRYLHSQPTQEDNVQGPRLESYFRQELPEDLLDYIFDKNADEQSDGQGLVNLPEEQLIYLPRQWEADQMENLPVLGHEQQDVPNDLLEYLLKQTQDDDQEQVVAASRGLYQGPRSPLKVQDQEPASGPPSASFAKVPKKGQPESAAGWMPMKRFEEAMAEESMHDAKPVLEGPIKITKYNQLVQADKGEDSQYQAVDVTHTFLLLDKEPNGRDDGEHIVHQLGQTLKLPTGTLSNVKVKSNQVTFKVNPNPRGYNASTIASKAEELKDDIKKRTGYGVTSAGIGDKTHLEVTSNKVAEESSQRMAYLTLALTGLVVSAVASALALFLVNRDKNFKDKVRNLVSGYVDTEASKDYQDLCRQRMQSKNNEKAEGVAPNPMGSNLAKDGSGAANSPNKRVATLSQQSSDASVAASPPSRSSTSSWSEEPVTLNMDISTGHMILTYMEDHLKNKNRLDKEWEALCAYEADPCTTVAATAGQNAKKNRYKDIVPYDHSRVVLNELSSSSGSDYINASTITDHDPRNPAYIATQGPLASTASDFWQMIWEQGSVIIVMLTRLMEGGVSMAARYWPEEGSEVYKNHEVHLVSEHIWCDDFLVRSFYLKNLATNETRTVTQFHFLSWPENGVPASAKAILDFRRKVNKSFRGRSCPIVVHCSDGVGRTGTYCLIDMVLNRMAKGAKEIDIAATLEHIRDQRMGLVKSKAQFEYVLKAVAEEVHAILKALQGGPNH